jgi:recombination protein RecR
MEFSPLIKQFIDALRILPGVGPKSAQRMAFYILERQREGGRHLADMLMQATTKVGHCEQCRILCEQKVCLICANEYRDATQLCVVQSPADVVAIEQAGGFKGYYFVLSGHLSPIDGMGPEEIGIAPLMLRLTSPSLTEVILATNSTVEGEATAYYISQLAKAQGKKASRIAYGVSVGGELEFVDLLTLSRALAGRSSI